MVGPKNEIGIQPIRGGDIIGDHTVLYAGLGERIELKHQAHSRKGFADGAIVAIVTQFNFIKSTLTVAITR